MQHRRHRRRAFDAAARILDHDVDHCASPRPPRVAQPRATAARPRRSPRAADIRVHDERVVVQQRVRRAVAKRASRARRGERLELRRPACRAALHSLALHPCMGDRRRRCRAIADADHDAAPAGRAHAARDTRPRCDRDRSHASAMGTRAQKSRSRGVRRARRRSYPLPVASAVRRAARAPQRCRAR